jgi:hypothetical protein
MQRKDDRERAKNPSLTLSVEKPELQFATRDDIPSHDAAGRALDPVSGKLAPEHQTARASELREQHKLNKGLVRPGHSIDGDTPGFSSAERLRGERKPLVTSDFDPDFESH